MLSLLRISRTPFNDPVILDKDNLISWSFMTFKGTMERIERNDRLTSQETSHFSSEWTGIDCTFLWVVLHPSKIGNHFASG